MKSALALAGGASLLLVVGAWWPLATPPPPAALETVGVQVVRAPTFGRTLGVLAERAPGLGLTLREHLATAIAEESARAGFDPLLVLAVIAVESEFREGAVSSMGARGLMQLQPATLYFLAEREGLRLSREEIDADPALRVRLGVRYLAFLQKQFGDLDLALMAYNAGPTRVFAGLKERNLEAFRRYVATVHREFLTLRTAQGEPGDWTFAVR